jgi:DNA helicase-2/ATP-dependent DNA helicase PcrA
MGVSSKNILAVTFTNKAAQEMQERLQQMIKAGTPIPLMTTFHGL